KEVLKGVTLDFIPGAKIAIIGPNGAGKSTLMKIMAGYDTEFTGDAWAEKGVNVGYLAQEPQLNPDKDVWGNVMEGVQATQDLLDRFNQVSIEYGETMEDALLTEMGDLQDKIDACDGWEIDNHVEIAMEALGCPPKDWKVESLSGGEKRRVALCKLLLEQPDMLLLDEPTNHLDAESVHWLEQFLQRYKGCVILVTHDRYFLDNVVEWVLELDRGQGIPFKGNYSTWLEAKEKRLEGETGKEEARRKAIKQELEWIKSSPKARQAKSKARIKAFDELVEKNADRSPGKAQIMIQPPERLGGKVIELDNVSKSYDGKALFEGLTFNLPPGGIVGVIGPNGAGKTT
ncbi:MAG: ATP-binding cassette domain-containing protein, partial [Sphingomonadales bacterium]|nr:ATP-binding cassette domain-containing protein [Sphingomonadales bacterium]